MISSTSKQKTLFGHTILTGYFWCSGGEEGWKTHHKGKNVVPVVVLGGHAQVDAGVGCLPFSFGGPWGAWVKVCHGRRGERKRKWVFMVQSWRGQRYKLRYETKIRQWIPLLFIPAKNWVADIEFKVLAIPFRVLSDMWHHVVTSFEFLCRRFRTYGKTWHALFSMNLLQDCYELWQQRSVSDSIIFLTIQICSSLLADSHNCHIEILPQNWLATGLSSTSMQHFIQNNQSTTERTGCQVFPVITRKIAVW